MDEMRAVVNDLVVYAAPSPEAVEPDHRVASLVHPTTGELLDPTKIEHVATWLKAVKDFEWQVVVTAKRVAEDLLYTEFDRLGKWTIETAGLKLAGESRTSWLDDSLLDVAALKTDLGVLVARGDLDEAAVESWFKSTLTLTDDGRRRIRALGGDAAALLDAHSVLKERKRRAITVRPA